MRPPPWLGSGTLGRDLALAGASLVGGLVLYALGWQPQVRPNTGVPSALFLPPLLAMCVAVGMRRVAPRASLAVGTGALVVDTALGNSLGTVLVYTQVLYDACVYGPPRLWRWLLRVTIGLSLIGAVVGVLVFGHWRGVTVGVLVVLAGLLPVLTGISVRQYRDQAAAERARAEQTARLVELDRRQAVSAERARMARELHDVVANHLSAVAIHATAVLSVPGLDRGQVSSALRVIRESSVQGLAEMRQMIELLREPGTGGGRAPAGDGTAVPEAVTARLAEADGLVERIRAAGLAVRVRTDGTPGPLPVGVDLAAYRIVQESLTNALKHGTGEADLTIAYRPAEVVVTVENPVRRGGDGLPGAGAGLIGMRERATLLAGRFTAGPRDGRWQVRAALPTGERG
ncbi:sensor histidine kinase [Micromonospora parathelypteridis]|uniref:histidine kinase n=1 Tax=Micromonospora parathelypteridis TaxID=1839617 RepID=A0A840VJA2_9ACTN|nr:histidine kinase [Micromonospora parathelypteridis]MBB5476827.1 signal transduction histidine kinase [Micromonospora parathelypteridis]GGO17222.1 two-component sensor histidine kinase [Micromonospora parathelypteridis]